MFSVCTEQRGQSPHSDKEIFLTLRATGHKQAREHPSGKYFIGRRVEKEEVGRGGREEGRRGREEERKRKRERARERVSMKQNYGKTIS